MGSKANILGNYISYNGKIFSIELFENDFSPNDIVIYEVIRIIDSIPLFLDLHLDRLKKSIDIKELIQPENTFIKDSIKELIAKNAIENCNIKISVYYNLDSTNTFQIVINFIPSKYPSTIEVRIGVYVKTIKAQRSLPSAKVENLNLRQYADEIIEQNNCYEVILVNDNEIITEGSRSNLFFIKENKMYTSDSKLVLDGVTRQMVFKIAKQEAIELNELEIRKNQINEFECAFLTGTSLGLLPVNRIDNKTFNVKNQLLHKLIDLYNVEVLNDLRDFHFK